MPMSGERNALGLLIKCAFGVVVALIPIYLTLYQVVCAGDGTMRPEPLSDSGWRHLLGCDGSIVKVAAASSSQNPPIHTGSIIADAQQALQAYYTGLNRHSFDENRYFATHVERFIAMKSTTPGAIGDYIRNVFPTQFKDAQFELVDGSLVVEDENSRIVTFVESSRFLRMQDHKRLQTRVRVRVRFTPEMKIELFHEYHILEQSEI